MLRNKLYYNVKPFVPRVIRTAIRRKLAARVRGRAAHCWPIMPGSERMPNDWPGWPNGKQFALVLTHDVEGNSGLTKCLDLMRLEQELGFRSSFNFIPEGSYEVPVEVRDELNHNGFEVGIHDLSHDGRLFLSRRTFSRKASRINNYLREWNAAGFRSGFMLHKLDWLHELHIQYDASTFDTDPFEPQPEGRHTIFPFWVPKPAAPKSGVSTRYESHNSIRNSHVLRTGYVELPYTLPQDFTLFLLLKEKTTEIWLRKLDWLAQHGGMALINVHPDYLCFDGDTPTTMEYPATHYRSFLEYVKQRYGDRFWNDTPRKIAQFFADTVSVENPDQDGELSSR